MRLKYYMYTAAYSFQQAHYLLIFGLQCMTQASAVAICREFQQGARRQAHRRLRPATQVTGTLARDPKYYVMVQYVIRHSLCGF